MIFEKTQKSLDYKIIENSLFPIKNKVLILLFTSQIFLSLMF